MRLRTAAICSSIFCSFHGETSAGNPGGCGVGCAQSAILNSTIRFEESRWSHGVGRATLLAAKTRNCDLLRVKQESPAQLHSFQMTYQSPKGRECPKNIGRLTLT